MENETTEKELIPDGIAALYQLRQEVLSSNKIGDKEANFICDHILPNYSLQPDFILGVVNQSFLLETINRIIKIKSTDVELGKLYDPFSTEPQKENLYNSYNEIQAYMCLRLLILERAVAKNYFPANNNN